MKLGSWALFFNEYVSNISTDKNALDLYSNNILGNTTNAIRFIIESEENPDSDWNRGRVVLGDIQFTYLV